MRSARLCSTLRVLADSAFGFRRFKVASVARARLLHDLLSSWCVNLFIYSDLYIYITPVIYINNFGNITINGVVGGLGANSDDEIRGFQTTDGIPDRIPKVESFLGTPSLTNHYSEVLRSFYFIQFIINPICWYSPAFLMVKLRSWVPFHRLHPLSHSYRCLNCRLLPLIPRYSKWVHWFWFVIPHKIPILVV